jgi:hypothetical protein
VTCVAPQVLERLVEALRSAQADGGAVHHAVLLCFRVLLLRVSPRALASFWPVAISELTRLLRAGAAPGAVPGVVYPALQFVDLALLLGPEEFQVMRWAFVRSLDAIAEGGDGGAGGDLGCGTGGGASQGGGGDEGDADIGADWGVDGAGGALEWAGAPGRPALGRAGVDTVGELRAAARAVRAAARRIDAGQGGEPDEEAILALLRAELEAVSAGLLSPPQSQPAPAEPAAEARPRSRPAAVPLAGRAGRGARVYRASPVVPQAPAVLPAEATGPLRSSRGAPREPGSGAAPRHAAGLFGAAPAPEPFAPAPTPALESAPAPAPPSAGATEGPPDGGRPWEADDKGQEGGVGGAPRAGSPGGGSEAAPTESASEAVSHDVSHEAAGGSPCGAAWRDALSPRAEQSEGTGAGGSGGAEGVAEQG